MAKICARAAHSQKTRTNKAAETSDLRLRRWPIRNQGIISLEMRIIFFIDLCFGIFKHMQKQCTPNQSGHVDALAALAASSAMCTCASLDYHSIFALVGCIFGESGLWQMSFRNRLHKPLKLV